MTQHDPERLAPGVAESALFVMQKAKGCAYKYVDFLSYELSDLDLPIRVIRPFWILEYDMEDT